MWDGDGVGGGGGVLVSDHLTVAAPADAFDGTEVIQRAITDAENAGMQGVVISEGVFIITRTLVVRGRDFYLKGDGMGRTILKEMDATPRMGMVVDGAAAYATIALCGATRCRVTDLTIDLREAPLTATNGIALLPIGEAYLGRVCGKCQVLRCEVLSSAKRHQYLIWNLRGRGTRIVGCRVDGGHEAGEVSHQEGIETLGGRDVEIYGNTIENIGANGINISAARAEAGKTQPELSVRSVTAFNNIIRDCANGIFVGTANDALNGAQNVSAVRLTRNIIRNIANYGIKLWADSGTRMTDVQLLGNSVATARIGISCYGHGDYLADHGETDPNLPGVASEALRTRWKAIRVNENVITDTQLAIELTRCNDVQVYRNEVQRAGTGVAATSVPGSLVERNALLNCAYPISTNMAEAPLIRDNTTL